MSNNSFGQEPYMHEYLLHMLIYSLDFMKKNLKWCTPVHSSEVKNFTVTEILSYIEWWGDCNLSGFICLIESSH